ncbi:YhbD family protein [Sutcliffiella halmapala]|uniref:YhbD family protein n=1 Tax=Sutcliffiella halmapala TaxID=79882 RepID=UPI0009956C62|nr:YhbD family protein [Sutcliffiella halmapala]
MEENLISKKDLLEIADISYGQLYRWKRKNLIPEDWFVRKSTFTGQETFFPKGQILERINKIKQLKDDLSLDALAEMFSSRPKEDISLSKKDLLERNIVSVLVFSLVAEPFKPEQALSFHTILFLYLLHKMLEQGDVSLEEGRLMYHLLEEHYEKLEQKKGELLLVRKMGVPFALLLENPKSLYLDDQVKVVVQLNIGAVVEDLKNTLIVGG